MCLAFLGRYHSCLPLLGSPTKPGGLSHAGWAVDKQSLKVPNAAGEVSDEVRTLEFESRSPDNASTGSVNIEVYALYYVCEDVDGQCLCRRQDVTIRIDVRD